MRSAPENIISWIDAPSLDMTNLLMKEADIILAEPGATVGFAGARVIEQTTKKALPEGFQKSEFVLEHGFIDSIIPRSNQKKYLTELLKMHDGRAMM